MTTWGSRTRAMLVFWMTLSASDFALAHFDVRTLPVSFAGEPWYVELAPSPNGTSRNGVSGSPVSDYGSHFGVKANLWQDRPLYLANYAAVPGLSRKLDRSVFDVLEEDGASIALTREVAFEPWGWRETAQAPGVTVTGTVTTLDTNAFLFVLDVNTDRAVRLRFRVFADDNTNEIYEGIFQPLPVGATAGFDPDAKELVIREHLGDQTVHAALQSGGDSWRVYRLSFPVTSTSFQPGLSTYSFDVLSEPISEASTFTTLLGVGLSEDEARTRADAAAGKTSGGPDAAIAAVESDWSEFFAAMPALPTGSSADEQRLYRMANTALRMNLVAPRARMSGWGSVPVKSHFNLFFGWDTPLQALGYAEWSGFTPTWIDQDTYGLAEQMLLLQLASQLPDGQICVTHDDSLACPLPFTQPPLQGWAAWEVARRDTDVARRKRFLEAAYGPLERFYRFWFLFRDVDLDGLPEYRAGIEWGWDDTPRYSGRDHDEGEVFLPARPVVPVELASWLAMYAGSMARIAGELGWAKKAAHWRAEAEAMVARIESKLWDEERGAWMDRLGSDVVDVRTPAMWWPVFAGAVSDATRSTRVVDDHLLSASAFFGTYPIPSVAYDDPLYDHAQDGYYWQGQVWLVPAYASLVALSRTGHGTEADVLLQRLVSMMAPFGGIFEAYDALSGNIGWGALGGPGVDPAAFQFGWSSALIAQALLRRHESMPGVFD